MPRFVPRERKHKKVSRVEKDDRNATNTNVETIIPETQSEKDARRTALKQQLHPENKISGKKRKRLDKYIDTKLKKEENAALLKKLAEQQVDTSLLQSSKKLGRVHESKRERLHRALQEKKAGLPSEDGVLFEPRREVAAKDGELDSDEQDSEDADAVTGVVLPQQDAISGSTFGGGLKSSLEADGSGQPLIKKRKRRKKASQLSPTLDQIDEDEEEWSGFSSDDDREKDGSQHEDAFVESSTSDNEPDSSDDDSKRPRISAFKQWADTLRNAAVGFTPSVPAENDSIAKARFRPREPSPEPMLQEIGVGAQSTTQQSTKPGSAITILREDDIQDARAELPVVREEHRIMEMVNAHPVVVVCGATGSGKTTQVPQMLFENGYGSHAGTKSTSSNPDPSRGMIGITQPRRVAATSVAERVKHELGPTFGSKVAHQVRYDTNVSRDTAIKFMTDGILLREIQQDFVLSKYSVIVLDEAHERSVNIDILIGMLARIVPLRSDLAKEEPEKHYPLKLVIMSATLSHGVDSFLQNEKLWKPFGGPPPVVEAEGRQFPVTVHFARKTRRDYVDEVVEKVTRGHKKLPPGGMLMFLTGQQEISTVAKRLRSKIGGAITFGGAHSRETTALDKDDYEEGFGGPQHRGEYLEGEEEDPSDADSEAEIKLDEEDAEFAIDDAELHYHGHHAGPRAPLKPHVLPLYAALPAAQQLRVFQPPPDGTRMIVLATNVAETSLTIPGIRYVFDSGRVKEKKYDTSTGVQTFEVDWISRASAEQRKGRAGRTGPGHVWRLYSSNVYEEFFAEETTPEILRTPLESVVLQLKSVEIKNVVTFPFPTQPETGSLAKAETLLRNLGAIDVRSDTMTELGKEVLRYPVSPRLGKMLLLARRNGLVAFAVAFVAGLAVGDLFIPENQIVDVNGIDDAHEVNSDQSEDENARIKSQEERAAKAANDKRHQAFTRAQATLSAWDDHSDAIKLLTSVAAHAEKKYKDHAADFCKDFWLRERGMTEVQLLRRQLHNIVNSTMPRTAAMSLTEFKEKLPSPSEKEVRLLNQIVAGGFIDQVAIRADALASSNIGFGRKPRRAIEVPYRTLFPSTEETLNPNLTLQDRELQRSVFIHPSSVLVKLSPAEMPKHIVYSHLSRAAPSEITTEANGAKVKRTRMHPLTAISPNVLAVLAEGTPLLQFGKPLTTIEELPRSEKGEKRRHSWVDVSLKDPSGGGGAEWPLSKWKVVQRQGVRGVWELEKVLAR